MPGASREVDHASCQGSIQLLLGTMSVRRLFAAILVALLFVAPASAQREIDPAVADGVQRWLALNSRPAIAVLRGRPSSDLNSTSWFGGLPRLPAELAWPEGKISHAPMSFIAQIDLRDLPSAAPRQGLPSEGVLWFFLDYDGILEESGRAAVLYDPRSGVSWPERQPPENLGRIIDEEPYSLLERGDALARLDFRSSIGFAPVQSYRLNGMSFEGAFVSEALELSSAARRDQIAETLGRAIQPGPDLGAPPTLDREDWPYAGLYAELAAAAVESQMPPLDVARFATEPVSWTRAGRALRSRIVGEARGQVRRWRARRFEPLSQQERADFRGWFQSVRTRAEHMQAAQTGGYRLIYSIFDYTIQRMDTYAAYAMMEHGVESPLLPPDYRGDFDWVGNEPPMHQMLGYGFSWQDGPALHQQDVLLLQIEGGADIAWLPDCMLHFWIPTQALAARAFDRVSTTLECD